MSIREYERGMSCGTGYESLSEKSRAKAVSGNTSDSERKDSSTQPESVQYLFTEVASSVELAKFMDVSASAYYKMGMSNFFTGGANGGANAKFVSQQQISRYSVYLLARVVVINSEESILKPELSVEARNCLEKEGSLAFYKRYGDEFVIGVTKGGEFFTLLEVKTTSDQERTEISSFLKANLVGKSFGELNGEQKAYMSELYHRYSREIEFKSFQKGGDCFTRPKTIDEIIDRMTNFPDMVKNHAVPYQARFSDYGILELPSGTNLINITKAKHDIDDLLERSSELLEIKSSINYILKYRDNFESFDYQKLSQTKTKLVQELNKIRTDIRQYIDEPDKFNSTKNDWNIEEEIQLPARKAKKNINVNHFFPSNPIDNLINKVLIIKPEVIGEMDYEFTIKHFSDIGRSEPKVKQAILLRQSYDQKQQLTHLILMCLDENGDPVYNVRGESYTREFLVKSLDDELNDLLNESDELLRFDLK